ncbi:MULTISPECIES: hypothetical protein [Paraburkholderia]|uniref:hypothetical protein n=1 Tax=Paraburkholderia TaxID=1822464 RepID=UPI002251CC1F|nr:MULTISPECIES: hypothetical protein [Paraburkholderia]MCX4159635.1 hypothetical protein [Paraburkholderia aspalathi]MDN7169033.1 hypothetical protein [Paraburkholderia sp. SECH2]MDQ6397520.1 hypothetical protein [Paraburkholderia aspalathi]
MPSDILTNGDDVRRIGVDLSSDELILLLEDYSLVKALPRFIDMQLSSSEDAHITDSEASGRKNIRVNTETSDSLDKTMPYAERSSYSASGFDDARGVDGSVIGMPGVAHSFCEKRVQPANYAIKSASSIPSRNRFLELFYFCKI